MAKESPYCEMERNVFRIVTNKSYEYNVIMERRDVGELDSFISDMFADRQPWYILDTKVKLNYPYILENGHYLPMIAGEPVKSTAMMLDTLGYLLKEGVGRRDILVAIGGGTIGDLVSYVVSTYSPINTYVYVPTTLVSQISSTVCSKVFLNFMGTRDILAAPFSPDFVIIDVEFLSSLSSFQLYAGALELIRNAIITDRRFFEIVENRIIDMFTPVIDLDVAEYLIYLTMNFRREHFDLFDGRPEFGRTIGNLVEESTNFEISYGTAIGYGMIVEGYLSYLEGYLSSHDYERISNLTSKFLISDIKELDIDRLLYGLKRNMLISEESVEVPILRGIGKVGWRRFSLNSFVDAMKFSLERVFSMIS